MGRTPHGRFPDLALVQFAVAHKAVYPDAQFADPSGHGDPVGKRQPLAQRSGASLKTRCHAGIGMALEHAAQLLQSGQVLHGNDAQLGQGCILCRDRVPLAHHETISTVPPGIGWIITHFVEIQGGDQFHDGQRAAKMMGLVRPHHPDDVVAQLAGGSFKLSQLAIVNHWVASNLYSPSPERGILNPLDTAGSCVLPALRACGKLLPSG